jgi:hypothetical protein
LRLATLAGDGTAAFVRVLASNAAHREWNREEALLRDVITAFRADTVLPLIHATKRCVDLIEHVCIHVDQRSIKIVKKIGGRESIRNRGVTSAFSLGADLVLLDCQPAHELMSTTLEELPDFAEPRFHASAWTGFGS